MAPKSVIVTGSNRGVGLGLVKQFLKNPEVRHVIATARDVEKADALNAIKDPRLHVLQLTVNCDKSIDVFVGKVSKIVGDDGLNLLLNNAAVFIKHDFKAEPDRKAIIEQFDTNTVSIVVLSQKLLPLLLKASKNPNNNAPDFSPSRAAIITISAGLGSISTNDIGSIRFQDLIHRMTKSAINQFGKTLSIDLREDQILVVNFCPGWVQTDMGTSAGQLTVEQSTSAIVNSIGKLNKEHNGGFFHRDLTVYPY